MADSGKKACFLIREPDGDSFRDSGDHFRRALGRPPFTHTPAFAHFVFRFVVHTSSLPPSLTFS